MGSLAAFFTAVAQGGEIASAAWRIYAVVQAAATAQGNAAPFEAMLIKVAKGESLSDADHGLIDAGEARFRANLHRART